MGGDPGKAMHLTSGIRKSPDLFPVRRPGPTCPPLPTPLSSLRMSPRILFSIAIVAILLACGAQEEAPPLSRGAVEPTPLAVPALLEENPGEEYATRPSNRARLVADKKKSSKKSGRKARRPNGERPLPAFEGRTLAGTRLTSSSLIGQRILFFFFNPENPGADVVSKAVLDVAADQTRHNFKIIGVGIGTTTSAVRRFAFAENFNFPVIDDSSGDITSLLRIPSPLVLLATDTEGYMTFARASFDTQPEDAGETIAARLRESLRIPVHEKLTEARPLIDHPKAPTFKTTYIGGREFDFANLAGRPVVLIFFLHTCPHCHHALNFFRKQLNKMPEAERPALVGISLQNRPTAVRRALEDENLDFFTPLVDPGQEIAQLYGLHSGVPDISLIDSEGHIIHRSQGWRDERDPALMRMYLARISDTKIPMLLSKKGYTGNDVCAVCHEREAASWELTRHAHAFDTLVTHGEERDGECVSCHVVGFDQPGGYTLQEPATHFENVGCESCHGRGGPHIAPTTPAEGSYEKACLQCHDSKHSLGFEFGSFLPNISHAAIAGLSDEERAKRFSGQGMKRDMLPANVAYVGSDRCESCHPAEFKTWSTSPHAHSLASLAKDNKTEDGECLTCHTTGYGRDGGFPELAASGKHPDLARVGCESCHGPGADHIGESAPKRGTILSLGDKCDSCVILQICGNCHDEENDSRFTFEVQEHIDRQRHGTIESEETPAPVPSAETSPEPSDAMRIGQALRLLEESI